MHQELSAISGDHSAPPASAVLSAPASDSGQGVAEYAIILAVIVVGAIALATAFSTQLGTVWTSVTTQMSALG